MGDKTCSTCSTRQSCSIRCTRQHIHKRSTTSKPSQKHGAQTAQPQAPSPTIPQTKADPVERILTREQEVQQARKAAEEKLAEAKDLESQWQAKQAEMDAALKVSSARLRAITTPLKVPQIIKTG